MSRVIKGIIRCDAEAHSWMRHSSSFRLLFFAALLLADSIEHFKKQLSGLTRKAARLSSASPGR